MALLVGKIIAKEKKIHKLFKNLFAELGEKINQSTYKLSLCKGVSSMFT
jgi:hypothetical protein